MPESVLNTILLYLKANDQDFCAANRYFGNVNTRNLNEIGPIVDCNSTLETVGRA